MNLVMRISAGGLIAVCLAAISCGPKARTDPPPVSRTPATTWDRQAAWEKAQKRIAKCDAEMTELEGRCVQDVLDFLNERKKGAPALAKNSLSLWGKARLVQSYMPWASGTEYRQFVAEQFKKHVFDEADLTGAVEKAVKKYLQGVEDIESRLLVDLRADLDDLPPSALPALATQETFRSEYGRLLEKAQQTAKADTGADAARLVASVAGGEAATHIALKVLQAVAVKLGYSGAVLGAGAASSWTTFGVGLVASVLVDYILDWVISYFYDAEAEVSSKVQQSVDRLGRLLTEGDQHTAGLRVQLRDIGQHRRQARDAALRDLILGTP